MKKILVFAFLLILILPACFAESMNVVVNNGHMGRVNDIAVQDTYNLIFTAGEDGTFRAWFEDTRNLAFSVQAAYVPLKRLALNPIQSQIAVVEQYSASSFAISVWDWFDGKKLYSIPLDQLPLHISFSPSGNQLIYSKAEWRSLRFFESDTGKPLQRLTDGFGIVTTFVLSPSERTIMTYQSSGSIQYWDMQEGTRKQMVYCPANLTSISFTQNLRYMFGYSGGQLLMIDATNGRTVFSRFTDPVVASAMNSLNGEACFLLTTPRGQDLLFIDTNSSTLQSRTISLRVGGGFHKVFYRYNSIYLCSDEGAVSIIDSRYFTRSFLSENKLAAVSGIHVNNNRIIAVTETDIYVFAAAVLKEDKDYEKPKDLYERRFANPFPGPAGIEYLDGDDYLIYGKTEPGRITLFNANFGSIGSMKAEFQSSIKTLSSQGNKIMVLESSGKAHVLNRYTLAKEFTYEALGLTNAAFLGGGIIGSKNRQIGFPSSLILVDTRSGETVPIPDTNIITYGLITDQEAGTLYTLGFENSGNGARTTLKEHSGPNFSRERVLLTFQGEDYAAGIYRLPDTSILYTTMGFDRITEISGTTLRVFKAQDNIPRSIAAHRGFLFTVNNDNTISIWDRVKGEKLGELYIFKDGSWIVTYVFGGYAASPYGDRYLSKAGGIPGRFP